MDIGGVGGRGKGQGYKGKGKRGKDNGEGAKGWGDWNDKGPKGWSGWADKGKSGKGKGDKGLEKGKGPGGDTKGKDKKGEKGDKPSCKGNVGNPHAGTQYHICKQRVPEIGPQAFIDFEKIDRDHCRSSSPSNANAFGKGVA